MIFSVLYQGVAGDDRETVSLSLVSSEFRQAMRLMRRRNPQLAEDGFQRLRSVAPDHLDELIVEFSREQDHGVRCWLLELIGEVGSDRALPVLAAELSGDDEALRGWAIRGLTMLNSVQARRLLWQWLQNQTGGAPEVEES